LKLTREEVQIVRNVFNKSPQLSFIPKPIWNSVAQLLSLKKLEKDEPIVRRGENMELYIVLTGSFKAEDKEVYNPGDAFGNFTILNEKKQEHKNFIATKISSVAKFSPNDLLILIQQENSNQSNKELLNFLSEAIPRFEQLSVTLRYRLSKCFTEKIYMTGNKLLTEGTLNNCVYLIKEGKCKVIASKDREKDQDQEINIENPMSSKIYAKANIQRGYRSVSTSKYQIMIIGAKEWVGEEILFEDCRWKPIDYSVVALVKTVALWITKENLNKFPGDVLSQIKKNNYEKQQWKINRKSELLKSIMKINKLDSSTKSSEKQKEKSRQAIPLLTHTNLSSMNKSIKVKATQRDRYMLSPSNNSNTLFQASTRSRWSKGFPFKSSGIAMQLKKIIGQQEIIGDHSRRTASNDFNTTAKKKVLEAASTFKAFNNKKLLCPIVICKPFIRKLVNPSHTPSDKIKKLLSLSNNEFVVGVKGVRIIDIDSLKPPPSPNADRLP